MAFRTSSGAVQSLLGDNFGPNSQGITPDLTQFIRTANVVVNRLVQVAANSAVFNGGISLGSDELERIEAYLACHFYAHSDQLYQSRSTQGASGQFQVGQLKEGFASTQYGRTAMDLDYSGSLKKINNLARAGAVWLGKPPSQQIPYDQRD